MTELIRRNINDNLFSGLEELGLNNLSNIIYDEDEKNDADDKKNGQEDAFSEEDILFDKSYTCPVYCF